MFAAAFALLIGSALLSCSDYENYSGERLRDMLKSDYYDGKHTQLGYTTAREYMYSYIDNDNNYIDSYYTGLSMYCRYGSMDTGCNSDLNCEHLVPQSFFDKDEPMRSDVHHLRPSYEDANSARSNYPFGNIDEDDVYKWYKGKTITTSDPPEDEMGEWSRLKKSTMWQPRDVKLGETARAVAYFYTMYPNYFNAIDRVGDINVFAAWNDEFPPADSELDRNDKVEYYQGNRNPYIDCPDLFALAFSDIM
eukprot:gnl/Chilomastix_cuspidata/11.p2 GENE.gnl/Chilomastix_cuspidata/11~~gnl/Chilomastix_cuspidata/11.p2  ORF type:complete len:250 (+),score=105.81 gnl/Chilomastix_cuspidata/11:46-795(+)